jgi:hypothetical protein
VVPGYKTEEQFPEVAIEPCEVDEEKASGAKARLILRALRHD